MARSCPVCKTDIVKDIEICPYCGFKLKGQTVSFAPISTERAIEETAIPRSDAPSCIHTSLRIIRGPQNPNFYPLNSNITTIGRNPHCDIFLNDMTVSRLHARILKLDNGYMLEDNRSYNGVWVNNANVVTRMLQNGDLIQIGAFCLVFEME